MGLFWQALIVAVLAAPPGVAGPATPPGGVGQATPPGGAPASPETVRAERELEAARARLFEVQDVVRQARLDLEVAQRRLEVARSRDALALLESRSDPDSRKRAEALKLKIDKLSSIISGDLPAIAALEKQVADLARRQDREGLKSATASLAQRRRRMARTLLEVELAEALAAGQETRAKAIQARLDRAQPD